MKHHLSSYYSRLRHHFRALRHKKSTATRETAPSTASAKRPLDIISERILDSDVLRQMPKVPRVVHSSKDPLRPVKPNSDEYHNDIGCIIARSFLEKELISQFNVVTAYRIVNWQLQEKFKAKKAEIQAAIAEESTDDPKVIVKQEVRHGFLYLAPGKNAFKQVQQLAESGVQRGNLPDSTLAVGTDGVSLSRHADRSSPSSGLAESGWLVVCRYIPGRTHRWTEGGSVVEPQPNYDSHESMRYSCPLETGEIRRVSLTASFHSSQVFLFEYGPDQELVDCPRHVLPVAAVQFEFTGTIRDRCLKRKAGQPQQQRQTKHSAPPPTMPQPTKSQPTQPAQQQPQMPPPTLNASDKENNSMDPPMTSSSSSSSSPEEARQQKRRQRQPHPDRHQLVKPFSGSNLIGEVHLPVLDGWFLKLGLASLEPRPCVFPFLQLGSKPAAFACRIVCAAELEACLANCGSLSMVDETPVCRLASSTAGYVSYLAGMLHPWCANRARTLFQMLAAQGRLLVAPIMEPTDGCAALCYLVPTASTLATKLRLNETACRTLGTGTIPNLVHVLIWLPKPRRQLLSSVDTGAQWEPVCQSARYYNYEDCFSGLADRLRLAAGQRRRVADAVATPAAPVPTAALDHRDPRFRPANSRLYANFAASASLSTSSVAGVPDSRAPVACASTPVPVSIATTAPAVTPVPVSIAITAPAVTPVPVSIATIAPAVTPVPVSKASPASTVTPVPVSISTTAPAVTPVPVSIATMAPAVTPVPVSKASPASTVTPVPGSKASPASTVTPLTGSKASPASIVAPVPGSKASPASTVTPVQGPKVLTATAPVKSEKLCAPTASAASSVNGPRFYSTPAATTAKTVPVPDACSIYTPAAATLPATPATSTATPATLTATPATSAATPATSTATPATLTTTPAPSTDSPATSTATPATLTITPAPSTDSPATSTATPATLTTTPAPSTDSPAILTAFTDTSAVTPATSAATPATSAPTPATSAATPATSAATPATSAATPAYCTATLAASKAATYLSDATPVVSSAAPAESSASTAMPATSALSAAPLAASVKFIATSGPMPTVVATGVPAPDQPIGAGISSRGACNNRRCSRDSGRTSGSRSSSQSTHKKFKREGSRSHGSGGKISDRHLNSDSSRYHSSNSHRRRHHTSSSHRSDRDRRRNISSRRSRSRSRTSDERPHRERHRQTESSTSPRPQDNEYDFDFRDDHRDRKSSFIYPAQPRSESKRKFSMIEALEQLNAEERAQADEMLNKLNAFLMSKRRRLNESHLASPSSSASSKAVTVAAASDNNVAATTGNAAANTASADNATTATGGTAYSAFYRQDILAFLTDSF